MDTNDIPDTNTVARYVRPTLIDGDIITGSAFCLRTGETGLSINWIERLTGNMREKLSEIRRRARIAYSKNGRIATLNVGRTRNFVLNESSPQCTIAFVADPLEPTSEYPIDDSHALIVGIPDGDSPEAEAIGDLIASCVENLFPTST
jgi:hypothetical protein